MNAVRYPTNPRLQRWVLVRNIACYVLACLAIGGLSGFLWNLVVTPSNYTVAEDQSLTITERGISEFFQADALYVLIGLLFGIGIGILAWYLFNRLGWPVVCIAVIGALVAGLVCWGVGYLIGPNDFVDRAASANTAGQKVPIDITLRSWSAVLVWAFGAVVAILLYSWLSHDPQSADEPESKNSPTRAETSPE